jgi:hypothetical protein
MKGIRVSGSEKGPKNKYPSGLGIYTKENVLKVTIGILNLLFTNDDMCSLLLDRTKGNTERKACQQS